ncbi:lysozyme [uncultured Clostridium sp.]|uniref:lysozyme n=1 Tax=uncultured Clostridium sp. TaxID=59620 RepID=UPI002607E8DA|nr:lysozyme [uncultured Clostridium sp.]
MKMSERGLELIKHFEGLKLEAYKCPSGVWTIGYGTTKGVTSGMKITKEKAEELLKLDVEKFEKSVLKLVKVDLNQSQFDALVSFAYNLGEGNLSSSTLLKMLNNKDYYGASQEFIRWNRANKKVLAGLTRRRESERNLFNCYPVYLVK